MNSPNAAFDEDIPSRRLGVLREVVGHRIVKMVHYSSDPPDVAARQRGITYQDAFGHTDGPLLLTTDNNSIVGFNSQESIASITVWMERTASGELNQYYPVLSDPDLHPVDANDETYCKAAFRSLIGRTVVRAVILKREYPIEGRQDDSLPREAGLVLEFDSRQAIVLSHWLHSGPDTFTILLPEEIPEDIQGKLHEFLVIEAGV